MTTRPLLALLVLAACGESSVPKFSAICTPNIHIDGVICKIQNLGKQRGRACVTVKLEPPEKQPIFLQRVCTAILDPQQQVEIVPPQPNIKACINEEEHRWLCPIKLVEDSRTLGENIPEAK